LLSGKVSLPLNWNQGKAEEGKETARLIVSLPLNWNQGKAAIQQYRPVRIVSLPLNWNQGKAIGNITCWWF